MKLYKESTDSKLSEFKKRKKGVQSLSSYQRCIKHKAHFSLSLQKDEGAADITAVTCNCSLFTSTYARDNTSDIKRGEVFL